MQVQPRKKHPSCKGLSCNFCSEHLLLWVGSQKPSRLLMWLSSKHPAPVFNFESAPVPGSCQVPTCLPSRPGCPAAPSHITDYFCPFTLLLLKPESQLHRSTTSPKSRAVLPAKGTANQKIAFHAKHKSLPWPTGGDVLIEPWIFSPLALHREGGWVATAPEVRHEREMCTSFQWSVKGSGCFLAGASAETPASISPTPSTALVPVTKQFL